MTYHSTQFFGVPWEIIAKDFRSAQTLLACPSLFGWVEEFKKFLLSEFCPSIEAQKSFVEDLIKDTFKQVKENFGDRQFPLLFLKSGNRRRKNLDQMLRKEFHNAVDEIADDYILSESLDVITAQEANDWLSIYKSEYDSICNEYFGRFPLKLNEHFKLKDLIVRVFKSSRPGEFTTGLVFAGFGEDELFPSLQCIEINGVINGNLRVVELEKVDIDRADTTAAVVPFADRDTVDGLLFGRTAEYEKQITEHFEEVIKQVGDALVDDLARGAVKNADYKGRVRAAATDAITRFKQKVAPDIDEAFSRDILDIVRHMPKQEIAGFAESLVSVSSIKRKVTVGPETVGGPIDVAVISRHEGFVWVRRKFYFTSDLNPRYMARQGHSVLIMPCRVRAADRS